MGVLVTVTAVAAGLGFLVYRYDLYDREPVGMLVVAVALGAGAMWLAGYHVEAWLVLRYQVTSRVHLAWLAAGCEEPAKLAVVVLIAMVWRRHFNDPMDGIIYGAFAGVGAALLEGIIHGQQQRPPVEGLPLLGQEAVRSLLHLMFGGLGGFAVGAARFRMRWWGAGLLLGLAAAMGLHFAWDYFIGLADEGDSFRRPAAVAVMLAALLCFGSAILLCSRWSRRALAPLSVRQLWGWPFVPVDRGPSNRSGQDGS